MFYFISFFCVYILCIRVLKFDGVELLIIVKDRLYCFSFYIIIIRGYDIISYICFGVYYCVLFVQGKYLYDDDLVKYMYGMCSLFFLLEFKV